MQHFWCGIAVWHPRDASLTVVEFGPVFPCAGWCPFGDDSTTQNQLPEVQTVTCAINPAVSNVPNPTFIVKFRYGVWLVLRVVKPSVPVLKNLVVLCSAGEPFENHVCCRQGCILGAHIVVGHGCAVRGGTGGNDYY